MLSRTDTAIWPWRSILLGATFALAAVLRLVGLESGLWYDEIVTLVLSARHPFGTILTDFPGVNVHPLYSVLAHASIGAFGESAWSLRLPACLFGLASIVMTYRLGVPLVGRTEAGVAALLLTTSYHHIWFSQNARGYTLLGFLTLLSTHALLRAAGSGRTRDYVVYALASFAGVYTHLTMVFVVAGHAAVVGLGIATMDRRLYVPLGPVSFAWAGIVALSAMAYAPFAASLLTIVGGASASDAARVATAGWALGEAARSLFSGPAASVPIAGALFAAIGIVGLWQRQPLACALCVAPGVVTLAALVALGQPIRPRFFFFLSGAAVLFVACGVGDSVGRFARRWPDRRPAWSAGVIGVGLALSAVSVAALPRNYQVPKQDFDGAVRFLTTAEAQGAEITVADPACLPFEAYFGKTWRCVTRIEDWPGPGRTSRRVLVVFTLTNYIHDPHVRERLFTACPIVRHFAGTLADGDITVCEAHRQGLP